MAAMNRSPVQIDEEKLAAMAEAYARSSLYFHVPLLITASPLPPLLLPAPTTIMQAKHTTQSSRCKTTFLKTPLDVHRLYLARLVGQQHGLLRSYAYHSWYALLYFHFRAFYFYVFFLIVFYILYIEYLAESGTGNVYRDIFITTLAEFPALILVFILVKTIGAASAQATYFIGSGILTVVIATVKVCFFSNFIFTSSQVTCINLYCRVWIHK
jgi:hypothetical protein